jgi:hypothetical protein
MTAIAPVAQRLWPLVQRGVRLPTVSSGGEWELGSMGARELDGRVICAERY